MSDFTGATVVDLGPYTIALVEGSLQITIPGFGELHLATHAEPAGVVSVTVAQFGEDDQPLECAVFRHEP